MGPAISSGLPGLPAGICLLKVDRPKVFLKNSCVISVSNRPGHNAFTVIPLDAYVDDIPLVRPQMPALEALYGCRGTVFEATKAFTEAMFMTRPHPLASIPGITASHM